MLKGLRKGHIMSEKKGGLVALKHRGTRMENRIILSSLAFDVLLVSWTTYGRSRIDYLPRQFHVLRRTL
jgi:hypothetical protein